MPYAQINGFRMYYEVAGCGVPLLFVHGGLGGGQGSARFRQIHLPALARHARVIAFDRRAAGASEAPPAGYHFATFVADLFALLDHLAVPRAVLMGVSAGGPLVLQAALDCPQRVLGLILASTAVQTLRPPPALAALLASLGAAGLAQLEALLPPQAPLAGALQTYLAYYRHGDALAARLGEITAPALILHGTADAEVPFAEAQRLHAALPRATLVPFVGGGHAILATHAGAYRQAIIDFVRQLPAS
ncbi:MAG: hypothetical protein KatS3mg131_2269 [Candidatus Tectimicrobiota bacterium]|nr:MAG: hypothetical protein KatS3mg131_2269 [Candidatus Tectomicrobia bacterium]